MIRTLFLCTLVIGLSAYTPAPQDKEGKAVSVLLDRFHEAASKADWDTYFSLMRDDMIFLGTDISERWDKATFKAYAAGAKNGWTYTVKDRHLDIDETGKTVWFDETLVNAKYGVSRGTGVAIRSENGDWLLAQYHLTFPIPNDLAAEMTKKIQDFTALAK